LPCACGIGASGNEPKHWRVEAPMRKLRLEDSACRDLLDQFTIGR
jgi:hypothetical protein